MIDEPFVTVIMPIRNEARTIRTALESVLDQDYPAERMEVLVVDGRSTDDTLGVVSDVAQERGGFRILDNPAGIVPPALNIGIQHARGEVIVRVDGHCSLERRYLRRCAALLETTKADCVGGRAETRSANSTLRGRAIALAMESRFGVGNAAFRTGRHKPGPVDTLLFGAYRREVFDRIGAFDDELVRNQDDEFNLRLVRAGGLIWMDPSLVSVYTSRPSLTALWRQYFQYGVYKVRVAQKHRGVASWRHLVPFVFVLGLAIAALASIALRNPLPLAAVLVPYGIANGIASVVTARRDPAAILFLPAAFATLHLSYGIGWVAGLWRWRHRFTDGSREVHRAS